MKMIQEKVLFSGKAYKDWQKQKRHFECDAIFIHLRFGIFIIETKGADDTNIVEERLDQAKGQLERIICGLEKIYLKVAGDRCPFEFRGVISVPNADVGVKRGSYDVLGKSEIESVRFKKFWISDEKWRQNIFQPDSENPIFSNLLSFIATIVGYRSAKFILMPSNAMEVYRIVEKQEFRKDRQQKDDSASENRRLLSMKSETIILNNEQLGAVNCSHQHVIISGPPGTGKTTVMLLRALEAAKLEKKGRVIVGAGFAYSSQRGYSDNLKALFMKFFEENKSEQLKRDICVESGFTEVTDPEDDLFYDEMIIVTEETEQKILWGRLPGSADIGTTTIVLTGRYEPYEVANDLTAALSHFPDFHHIELKTVIRGTHSIVNEWKRFFPEEYFKLGHNVKGSPVDQVVVGDCDNVLAIIKQKLSALLKGNYNNDGLVIAPEHIAILVATDFRCVGEHG